MKRITEEDKEWHQVIVSLFTKELGLKTQPVIIYSNKQIKKYSKRKPSIHLGVSLTDSETIWISPDHANYPKKDVVDTIYHELLHIKYRRMSESKVRELTRKRLY